LKDFCKDDFGELHVLNVFWSQTLCVVQWKSLKRNQNFRGQDPLQCPWAAGCDVFFGQHIQTVSTMALLESSAYTSHAQLVAQLHRLCHLVFNLEA